MASAHRLLIVNSQKDFQTPSSIMSSQWVSRSGRVKWTFQSEFSRIWLSTSSQAQKPLLLAWLIDYYLRSTRCERMEFFPDKNKFHQINIQHEMEKGVKRVVRFARPWPMDRRLKSKIVNIYAFGYLRSSNAMLRCDSLNVANEAGGSEKWIWEEPRWWIGRMEKIGETQPHKHIVHERINFWTKLIFDSCYLTTDVQIQTN